MNATISVINLGSSVSLIVKNAFAEFQKKRFCFRGIGFWFAFGGMGFWRGFQLWETNNYLNYWTIIKFQESTLQRPKASYFQWWSSYPSFFFVILGLGANVFFFLVFLEILIGNWEWRRLTPLSILLAGQRGRSSPHLTPSSFRAAGAPTSCPPSFPLHPLTKHRSQLHPFQEPSFCLPNKMQDLREWTYPKGRLYSFVCSDRCAERGRYAGNRSQKDVSKGLQRLCRVFFSLNPSTAGGLSPAGLRREWPLHGNLPLFASILRPHLGSLSATFCCYLLQIVSYLLKVLLLSTSGTFHSLLRLSLLFTHSNKKYLQNPQKGLRLVSRGHPWVFVLICVHTPQGICASSRPRHSTEERILKILALIWEQNGNRG